MTMTDKDRFDACMKQADFLYQRVYNRQSYQWKVTLGLWALIAGAVSLWWEKHIGIPVWVVPVVPSIYGFLWLRAISIHNFDDQRAAMHFRDEAEEVLTSGAHRVKPRPRRSTFRTLRWWFGFLINWAHFFELLTTVALVVAAYYLLRK